MYFLGDINASSECFLQYLCLPRCISTTKVIRRFACIVFSWPIITVLGIRENIFCKEKQSATFTQVLVGSVEIKSEGRASLLKNYFSLCYCLAANPGTGHGISLCMNLCHLHWRWKI
jgi:hypothetical protein